MAKEWACVLAAARPAELAVSARSSAWCGAHATWSLVGSGQGLTWSDTGLVQVLVRVVPVLIRVGFGLVRVVSDLTRVVQSGSNRSELVF